MFSSFNWGKSKKRTLNNKLRVYSRTLDLSSLSHHDEKLTVKELPTPINIRLVDLDAVDEPFESDSKGFWHESAISNWNVSKAGLKDIFSTYMEDVDDGASKDPKFNFYDVLDDDHVDDAYIKYDAVDSKGDMVLILEYSDVSNSDFVKICEYNGVRPSEAAWLPSLVVAIRCNDVNGSKVTKRIAEFIKLASKGCLGWNVATMISNW